MLNVVSNIEMIPSDFLKISELLKTVKFRKSKVVNVSCILVNKIKILINWDFFLGKEINNTEISIVPEILYQNKYFKNKWNSAMNLFFSSWKANEIYAFLSNMNFENSWNETFDEIFILENPIEFLIDTIYDKIDYENYKNENEKALDKMWDECKEIKTENDNIFQLMKYTESENEKLNTENAKYMRDNLILKEELRDIIKEYKELDSLYKKKNEDTLFLETQLILINEKYEMQKNELMLILDKNESLLDENDELYEKLANEKNNCFKFWNF